LIGKDAEVRTPAIPANLKSEIRRIRVAQTKRNIRWSPETEPNPLLWSVRAQPHDTSAARCGIRRRNIESPTDANIFVKASANVGHRRADGHLLRE
jgi:hypothetical protein